jgi:hypothetical protein
MLFKYLTWHISIIVANPAKINKQHPTIILSQVILKRGNTMKIKLIPILFLGLFAAQVANAECAVSIPAIVA